jgi:hypothetical protein
MEEEKVQEVVNEEVMTIGKDERSRYLEDEDVEITTIKNPFHQQLKRELLMQPEKGK